MTVTIYDVARQAGVAISTVSRVLNKNPNVSSETRERVLAAIAALDYCPSPIAQGFSRRKTLTIGVIAVFFTRPSVVERLRGIEALIADSEYDLIVYNVETPTRRDERFRNVAAGHRLDGLLIISLTPDDDSVARWERAGLPVVLVDTSHPALHQIVIDDVAGGFRATQHLIELGHRRIAFVGDPLHTAFNFTSSRNRLEGLRRALAHYDIPFRPEYHQAGEHGQEPARQLTHQLLTLSEPPTAIFAASDTQAFGALQAARERGLHVPQDLSVIGFDDIEMAEYMNLTTIRQPLFDSGYRGMSLLLQIMHGSKPATICQELPIELITRGSTAPPRA